MKQFLNHKSIFVRFFSLYAIGIIIFIIAWYLGYALLPEGILRGKSAAAQIAGNEAADSLLKELIKIFLINLFSASIIIFANFNSKVKGYPLGYLIPVLWLMHYGLLLGTNSFSIPMPYRMAPSFEVLNRSGLYEIASYTLVAVSTYSLPRYEANSIFSLKQKAISPQDRHPMTKEQWIGIIVAIFILFLSNLREAYNIITA